MVKASKHRYADYDRRIGRRLERWLGRSALFEPLMRARGVEVAEAVSTRTIFGFSSLGEPPFHAAARADFWTRTGQGTLEVASLSANPRDHHPPEP
jgi:hypothetical protein